MTCEHNLTTSFGPSSTVNPTITLLSDRETSHQQPCHSSAWFSLWSCDKTLPSEILLYSSKLCSSVGSDQVTSGHVLWVDTWISGLLYTCPRNLQWKVCDSEEHGGTDTCPKQTVVGVDQQRHVPRSVMKTEFSGKHWFNNLNGLCVKSKVWLLDV